MIIPGRETKAAVTVQVPECLMVEFRATVSAFINEHRDGSPPVGTHTLVYATEEETQLLSRFRASGGR